MFGLLLLLEEKLRSDQESRKYAEGRRGGEGLPTFSFASICDTANFNPTLKITIFVLNSSVGLVMRGKILLNAGFVSLDLNFNVEKEPKLNLNTDVDFAVENVLCMQLSQPDDVFK